MRTEFVKGISTFLVRCISPLGCCRGSKWCGMASGTYDPYKYTTLETLIIDVRIIKITSLCCERTCGIVKIQAVL